MRHHEFDPPPSLQNSIKCFWYNIRDFGETETGFEVQPDGYAEIIFHFGSGCNIAENAVLKPMPSPFMMGLLNQPVVFFTKKRFEVIGIRCFPWTVFELLGLDSDKQSVRIFEHPIAQLQAPLQRLVALNKIEDAIALVRRYFLKIESPALIDNVLLKAGSAMSKANGTIPVSEVAAAAHATVRTLERKFKQSSGHSVKDVSGLMRFEKARNQLWLSPTSNLAGLAHELGYNDQSHLTREFKRYSGTTPAAFARKAKKEKRTINTDFVMFTEG